MIKNFGHQGLEKFYRTGSVAGIKAAHARQLARQMARLNQATRPADVNVPGWKLHLLKGNRSGQWAISVSANWRLVFKFSGGDVLDVDYED